MWVSKLQGEISLSTFHAEYVALSQSTRDLIIIKKLVSEVVKEVVHDPQIIDLSTH